MLVLVETLQKRIKELEDENLELKRENRRYANAHTSLACDRERFLTKLRCAGIEPYEAHKAS